MERKDWRDLMRNEEDWEILRKGEVKLIDEDGIGWIVKLVDNERKELKKIVEKSWGMDEKKKSIGKEKMEGIERIEKKEILEKLMEKKRGNEEEEDNRKKMRRVEVEKMIGEELKKDKKMRINKLEVLEEIEEEIMRKVECWRGIVRKKNEEKILKIEKELVMVDEERRSKKNEVGDILIMNILEKVVGCEWNKSLRIEKDREEDGMVEIGGLSEKVEEDIVGSIVRREDIMNDEMILELKIEIVEFGGGKDIGKNVDGKRNIVEKKEGIIGGGIKDGGGVDIEKKILNVRWDMKGCKVLSEIERNMIKKMRN